MRAIVNVDPDWGIGRQGALLVRIPEDMAFFRRMTRGRTIVVGRETLATFPRGAPLPGRANIVLTRDPGFAAPGARTAHSLDALHAMLKDVPAEEIYVVGGASVYAQLLPFCSVAYITKTRAPAGLRADRFFPDLDADPDWQLAEESEERTHAELTYRFCTYRRAAPRP